MIISIENNITSVENIQFSYTASNISSGGTAIPLKNINSFNNQWAIQLGKTGESQSEILVISGTPASGTANTSGTLRFDHSIDTPVYQIHYDQLIVKRSITGTAGTAVAIGTTNITPNSLFTEYNDSTGTSTYAYKTQFYNSVSTDVSTESDWFVPSGPTFYSLQSMRKRMKDALFNANYIKSDDVINDWLNEWIEIMTNSAIKVNKGYSMGTVDIAFGTAGYGTVTSSDFKQANKIELTFDGSNYVNSNEIPLNRFSRSDSFSGLAPYHYWQGDTVFGVLPQGNLGTARVAYSKLATRLENDSDELPLSLRSYTTSCVEYGLYKAYDNDMKADFAASHYQKFEKSQQAFISEITPRDQSGIKMIEFTDSLSGGEDSIDLISDFIF